MCLYVESPLGTSVSNEQEAGSSTPEKKKPSIWNTGWEVDIKQLILMSQFVFQALSHKVLCYFKNVQRHLCENKWVNSNNKIIQVNKSLRYFSTVLEASCYIAFRRATEKWPNFYLDQGPSLWVKPKRSISF